MSKYVEAPQSLSLEGSTTQGLAMDTTVLIYQSQVDGELTIIVP